MSLRGDITKHRLGFGKIPISPPPTIRRETFFLLKQQPESLSSSIASDFEVLELLKGIAQKRVGIGIFANSMST